VIDLPPSASTPEACAAHADAPAPDPARIDAQVEAQRVAILHELTSLPVMAGMAFGVLVAAVLWKYRPPLVVCSWLAFKIVIGTLRLMETRRYFRRVETDGDAPAWRRRSLLLLLLDALVWGAMGVIFMPADAPGIRAVMLASLIGIAGVGVFSYVSDARGCVLFLFTLLLPSALVQAQRGLDEGWLAALGIVVYLGLMCLEALRSESRVVQMLRLRFENAWIAEERQRAMRLSEHANAAKSRFLATVSHEMRTPLNGILGMTQMLQRSSLDAEQRAQLEIIHDSSRHLQTVIGDLLDLSRIEFGKLVIDERPFALADTVREVTGLLGAVATDKGLRFELEWSDGLPAWVTGDASRVKQVLHNLLGNAIKFTAHGEVRLAIGRHDGELRFVVSDSGDGVPPEMRETIFNAFEQGPSATAQGRNGTGLGLTISRRLARAMGGDVRCSEPGAAGGATFIFTMACRLPLADPMPSAPRAEPAVASLVGRVLVVDDNPVNALVATAMLKRAGLDVEVAEDGLAAIERMNSGGIDLVLMDCQLPILDGWEATRRWRRSERPGERLPIVALTANAVLGDRERCLAAGMDDYLPKPVDLDALIAVVTRLLTRPALRQAG
jgi:signal transduction histidine kinase/CheY-like chemotaxis protein